MSALLLIPVRLIRWPLPVAIHVSASDVPHLPRPFAPVYDKEQDDKTTNEAMFFLHMRRHISYIFKLLIIALVSNRQVKEARSCFGTCYPNWPVFGKTFCREKCDSEGNKLML